MAYKNKTIVNSKTGQKIKFITTAKDSNGRLLEMISTYSPYSPEPPDHYHPYQTEHFRVLSGELTIKMNEDVLVLKSGDSLHIPANTPHAMWNDSEDNTVLNWKVEPAMNTEHLLETFTGLSTDGNTNEAGVPPILQTALIANKYSDVFRLSKPGFVIQKILFTMLTPFAYLSGYRGSYKKYLD